MIDRPVIVWIGDLPTVRTADVRASIEYERERNRLDGREPKPPLQPRPEDPKSR